MRWKKIVLNVAFLFSVVFWALIGAALVATALGPTAHAGDGESAGLSNGVSVGLKFDRRGGLYRWQVASATDATTVAQLTTAAVTTGLAGSSAPPVTFDGTTQITLGGRADLPVTLLFSNAGATATYFVAYYYRLSSTAAPGRLLGITDDVSVTATSTRDATGRYLGALNSSHTFGASHAIILVRSVSAGTVDVDAGSY